VPASARRTEKYAKIRKQTESAVSPKPEPPGPDWSFVQRACTAPNGKRHEPAFRFLAEKNRNRIALAGRQSGKTWAVFVAMIDVALKKENAVGLYLSFSAAATQRTTWQTLKRVIPAGPAGPGKAGGRVDGAPLMGQTRTGHSLAHPEMLSGSEPIDVEDPVRGYARSRLRMLLQCLLRVRKKRACLIA